LLGDFPQARGDLLVQGVRVRFCDVAVGEVLAADVLQLGRSRNVDCRRRALRDRLQEELGQSVENVSGGVVAPEFGGDHPRMQTVGEDFLVRETTGELVRKENVANLTSRICSEGSVMFFPSKIVEINSASSVSHRRNIDDS